MKEMKYQSKRVNAPEILDEGEYKNHHYVILNLGTHPTAYVEIKKSIDEDISVHGGVTYNGGAYWNKEDTRSYAGWDYAHLGDYYGADEVMANYGICYPENKKWTTEEIIEEVKGAIDQVVIFEKKEPGNE